MLSVQEFTPLILWQINFPAYIVSAIPIITNNNNAIQIGQKIKKKFHSIILIFFKPTNSNDKPKAHL